jgi:hypothetical protein
VAPLKTFEILSGSDHLKWFQSSIPSQRGFCDRCGSTLFFKSSICPEEIHITRANLIDEVELSPRYHCFADKKVDWITISDGIETLDSDNKELSQYQQIPPVPRE